MKRINFLMAAILLITSPATFAENIYSNSPSEAHFIQVQELAPEIVRFLICEKDDIRLCEVVGNESGYKIKDLQKRRNVLIAQGVGVAVLDVAIVAGIAFGGAYAAAGLTAGLFGLTSAAATGSFVEGIYLIMAAPSIAFGATLGGVTGGGIGYLIVKYIEPIWAPSYFKKARTLKVDVVLEPGDLVIKKSIYAFADSLEDALLNMPESGVRARSLIID